MKKPHHGIIRMMNHAAKEQGPVCLEMLVKYQNELQQGAIITVEKTRVRIRPRDEH